MRRTEILLFVVYEHGCPRYYLPSVAMQPTRMCLPGPGMVGPRTFPFFTLSHAATNDVNPQPSSKISSVEAVTQGCHTAEPTILKSRRVNCNEVLCAMRLVRELTRGPALSSSVKTAVQFGFLWLLGANPPPNKRTIAKQGVVLSLPPALHAHLLGRPDCPSAASTSRRASCMKALFKTDTHGDDANQPGSLRLLFACLFPFDNWYRLQVAIRATHAEGSPRPETLAVWLHSTAARRAWHDTTNPRPPGVFATDPRELLALSATAIRIGRRIFLLQENAAREGEKKGETQEKRSGIRSFF